VAILPVESQMEEADDCVIGTGLQNYAKSHSGILAMIGGDTLQVDRALVAIITPVAT